MSKLDSRQQFYLLKQRFPPFLRIMRAENKSHMGQLTEPVLRCPILMFLLFPVSGYHHSLPSSPYSSSGPEAQRLAASGALSSEFLNHGGGTAKILLLVCNAAGAGQQAVR